MRTRLPIREKAIVHLTIDRLRRKILNANHKEIVPEGTGAFQRCMKTEFSLFHARLFCAVALGVGSSFSLAVAAEDPAGPALTKTSIPWSHLGAKAGADYQGDGLAVSPTAGGARLRCVFQRLEGEATREGLWLTSTVNPPSGKVSDRFRVVAVQVGRDGAERVQSSNVGENDAAGEVYATGTVQVKQKVVRFTRPGLSAQVR